MDNSAEQIVISALKKRVNNLESLNAIKRQILRSKKGASHSPNTAELIKAYHELTRQNKIKKNPVFEKIMVKRAVRTLSGVSIITVLTKPHACPGQCIYCPDEPAMPKSYISDEPAAARASLLRFDPFDQVRARISALEKNGHPTDKIELIVKGGTWSAYPLSYQYWFILRCFEAANTISPFAAFSLSLRTSARGGRSGGQTLAKATAASLLKKLFLAQKKNEKVKHRIIGLTLETRPDFITAKTILQMRELGCTRVELGVQTVDDKNLKIIKRGHTAAESARATKLLKNYGFKVDYHLMPQLPGSTPAKDAKMLAEIFDNPVYRPDMIKIYPCTVVKNSPLYKWVKSGKFKPYSDKKLIETLIQFKTIIPRYARISRLIRDIPGHHIVAGNTMTNLRQVIQAEMAKRGLRCNCLRCREIGHATCHPERSEGYLRPKLFIDKYTASSGTEYFLSFEDAKRNVVYAFCRLRIDAHGFYPAFIRELHTYGQMLKIGAKNSKASQHRGFGAQLIAEVEKISKRNRIPKLAVISGAGVRDYYRKFGYKLENTYMVKNFLYE